jgi:hypothetical protein
LGREPLRGFQPEGHTTKIQAFYWDGAVIRAFMVARMVSSGMASNWRQGAS